MTTNPYRRMSLLDQNGAVVGRSDEQDAAGFIPVEQGATIVAIRVGDFVSTRTEVVGIPDEARIAVQSFAAPGFFHVSRTFHDV